MGDIQQAFAGTQETGVGAEWLGGLRLLLGGQRFAEPSHDIEIRTAAIVVRSRCAGAVDGRATSSSSTVLTSITS